MARGPVRARGIRTVIGYASLVTVPVVLAVVLLASASGHGGHPGPVTAADPFARLFLAIAVIVALRTVAGSLVTRIGQPPVVGEIAAGIVLGPTVLGSGPDSGGPGHVGCGCGASRSWGWPRSASWAVPRWRPA